jgi:hypothetical protein
MEPQIMEPLIAARSWAPAVTPPRSWPDGRV